MGTKHTQGEWKYAPLQREHGEGLVFTGDDPENADAHIAVVSGGLGYVMEDGRCFESEANAALIASAPDLLEACKALVKELEDDNESLSLSAGYARADLIIHAIAAIAKAEAAQ